MMTVGLCKMIEQVRNCSECHFNKLTISRVKLKRALPQKHHPIPVACFRHS